MITTLVSEDKQYVGVVMTVAQAAHLYALLNFSAANDHARKMMGEENFFINERFSAALHTELGSVEGLKEDARRVM